MGCDGGSIAGRQELVKTKKKEVKETSAAEIQEQRMTNCAISQSLLIPPIVADHVGNLFNKSALLEYLLATSRTHTTQTQMSHITSLKDVINCKLTYDESKKDTISGYAPYMCPVTSLPANGRYRFVVMTGCGCVLSERAIKQVPSTKCLVCHTDLISSPSLPNYFLIAPTPEEYDVMHLAFEQRKAAAKLQKKDKKKKKDTTIEHKEQTSSPTSITSTSSPESTISTSTTSPTSSSTSPPPLESKEQTSLVDRGTKRKLETTSTVTSTTKVTSTSTGTVKSTTTTAAVKSTSTSSKPSTIDKSTTTSSKPSTTSHIDKRPRVENRDAWKIEEAARIKKEQDERDAAFWKDKSDVYKKLFRKPERYEKPNPISSKPISCMGML